MERETRDAMLAPGALIAGKYRIERELGAGGVGVVVLARHVELGHRVAIKYLRSKNDPNLVARFKREGRLAAGLRSEHVVRVHDVGTLPDGAPFMVMEYLEGEDLDAVLRRNGPLPIAQAVAWTLQACQALTEVHEVGIVHRDLKPANLFLARRAGGPPIIKIVDFGISKVARGQETPSLRPGMTGCHESFGTPLYMSPEQLVSSAGVDARSDVWAIGVVLYELLTGRLPFESGDLRQLVAEILSVQARPIRSWRGEIPVELAAIIHTCLSFEPSARPASVIELASRLAPFASESYVNRLGLAETAPEGSGLHDLAWAPDGSAPRTRPTIEREAPVARSPVRLVVAALGAASALTGAIVVVALTLLRPALTTAPVAARSEALVAPPMPAATQTFEIVEVLNTEPPPAIDAGVAEPPRPARAIAARTAMPSPSPSPSPPSPPTSRPARAASPNEDFGDRR